MIDKNPYRTLHARMSPPGAAWDEGFVAGRAAATPRCDACDEPFDGQCAACRAEDDARHPQDEFDGAGCCPEEDGFLRAKARAAATSDQPEPCEKCRVARAASPDERLREAAERLLVAFAAEEDEHGFPFSFELRDAHRALVAATDRDKPGQRPWATDEDYAAEHAEKPKRNHAPWCEGGHGDTPCPATDRDKPETDT